MFRGAIDVASIAIYWSGGFKRDQKQQIVSNYGAQATASMSPIVTDNLLFLVTLESSGPVNGH